MMGESPIFCEGGCTCRAVPAAGEYRDAGQLWPAESQARSQALLAARSE